MLQNETLVAKIGFDTEENDEPAKVSRKLFRHFSQPPYSEFVKTNEIWNILHNFRKIVESAMNFHQNQYEKHRILI